MNEKLFIPLILGTNRKGSQSAVAARWIFGEIEKHPDIETKFFDASAFAFPSDDCCGAIKDNFPEYRDAIIRADGLVIVAPEYNHGYPGVLKSILDLLLAEYTHKAAGLVGVSAGPIGGARMVEQLVGVCRELGLIPIKKSIHFSAVQDVFSTEGGSASGGDSAGNLKNEMYREQVKTFLNELVWMARALKWGRENLEK